MLLYLLIYHRQIEFQTAVPNYKTQNIYFFLSAFEKIFFKWYIKKVDFFTNCDKKLHSSCVLWGENKINMEYFRCRILYTKIYLQS